MYGVQVGFNMKLAVLFSGGKDSTLAMHIAKRYSHNIELLLSVSPQKAESYMFHYPNTNLTKIQSKALNIPLISVKTEGKKEKELKALFYLFNKAKKEGIEGIVTGAVKSTYQAERIQKVAYEYKLEVFNPLWQKEDEEILELLEKYKIKAIITGIAAYPLSSELLGKNILEVKEELLDFKKKYNISAVGEGGELETFVTDAPMFEKTIDIIKTTKEYKNYSGQMIISEVKLKNKRKNI